MTGPKPDRRQGNVAIFVPHAGCPHRCSFCSQGTITGKGDDVPDGREAARICRQAAADLGDQAGSYEIAFFGGSFTAIPMAQMKELLEAASPFLTGHGGKFRGIRVSTRPDAIDGERLGVLKQFGVTTVELGAQSMDDRVLEMNRRGHTSAQVEQASRMIKETGFSLGLQMMTGLFGASQESDRETARRLAALLPDQVRVYPTVVLEGTPLAKLYRDGSYQPPALEDTVALCTDLLDYFEQKGIPVIRLGLHASQDVESHYLAGAYHPALRELCEGERYYGRLSAKLREFPEGVPVRIAVNPKDISKALGQKKRNLRRLQEAGYRCVFRQDPGMGSGEFAVETEFTWKERGPCV